MFNFFKKTNQLLENAVYGPEVDAMVLESLLDHKHKLKFKGTLYSIMHPSIYIFQCQICHETTRYWKYVIDRLLTDRNLSYEEAFSWLHAEVFD